MPCSYSKLSQGHKEAFCCPDCVVTGGLPSKEVGFIAYESEFYWKSSIHSTDHNQTVRIIHVFCNQNRLNCRRFHILLCWWEDLDTSMYYFALP